MWNKDLIQKLKQSNISKDSEKTKERVKATWQSIKSGQKNDVIELADVTVASVYRVFRTGAVSAKLVIPISETAGVDPYYLTGASDDIGKFSDELAIKLLTELGYSKILDGYRQNPKKSRKNKIQSLDEGSARELTASAEVEDSQATVEIPHPADARVAGESDENAAETPVASISVAGDLTEDEAILLLKAILLRDRLNIAGAKEQSDKIRQLLLS